MIGVRRYPENAMARVKSRSLSEITAFLAALFAGAASAQSYPAKPLRLIVPFTAGAGPDITARLVAGAMTQGLGQPVIAENRVGAGGRIAAEFVARAAPDGYTLLLGSASTHMVSPHLVKDMPYDPFTSFTPISIAVTPATALVVPASLPVRSMAELVDYARANPGKIAFGSNGIGSSAHLVGELIKMAAGIDMLHVPFKGANEVTTAMLSGQVQMQFSSPGATRAYVTAGKMRLLAILASKRFAGAPELPTLTEALPGYEAVTDWFGFFAPASLPAPILSRLHGEIVRGLNTPELRAEFDKLTYIIIANTPEEFAALMKREFQIYAKVIKSVNIPMQ
jgi:tripartite-type tricarboxylate transporter receptor subunit TctC